MMAMEDMAGKFIRFLFAIKTIEQERYPVNQIAEVHANLRMIWDDYCSWKTFFSCDCHHILFCQYGAI